MHQPYSIQSDGHDDVSCEMIITNDKLTITDNKGLAKIFSVPIFSSEIIFSGKPKDALNLFKKFCFRYVKICHKL